MSTQYYTPAERRPEQHDPRRQGQEPTPEQFTRGYVPTAPMWQQGQYPARRSTPWGAIVAVGAAVAVACTLAFVFLFAHSSTGTTNGGTPASTSGSNQPAPVNPAVPTHPAVNPAVPSQPAANPAVPSQPAANPAVPTHPAS
jgi:hypothetical protein